MKLLIVSGLSGSGKSIALDTLEDCKFDSSWNWIMPACAKWDKLFDGKAEVPYKYCQLSDYLDLEVALYEINGIFEQLVENVKWYNEFKKDKNEKVD